MVVEWIFELLKEYSPVNIMLLLRSPWGMFFIGRRIVGLESNLKVFKYWLKFELVTVVDTGANNGANNNKFGNFLGVYIHDGDNANTLKILSLDDVFVIYAAKGAKTEPIMIKSVMLLVMVLLGKIYMMEMILLWDDVFVISADKLYSYLLLLL